MYIARPLPLQQSTNMYEPVGVEGADPRGHHAHARARPALDAQVALPAPDSLEQLLLDPHACVLLLGVWGRGHEVVVEGGVRYVGGGREGGGAFVGMS